MTETRAKTLLDSAGIKFEREPAWITSGRKPDFYCSEPHECWVEVKTLELTADSQSLSAVFKDLRTRTAGLSGTGIGIAHVHEDLSHGEAKLAVQLLKRAVKRFGDANPPDTVVALVPKDRVANQFVRFSVTTRKNNRVEFHSCVSASGRYAVPHEFYPEPDTQTISLTFSSGRAKEADANTVIEMDDYRAAIVVEPSDKDFQIITAFPTGSNRRLHNEARIREVVSDANEQAKNASLYKEAPGVTMIFHDGLDVPDDAIVKSALYENLKYLAPKENPGAGKLILDGDGVWNATKNRTTSAVIYVRNAGQPILIHNYWAERPLPSGLFLCKEFSVAGDGSFQETDYSAAPASAQENVAIEDPRAGLLDQNRTDSRPDTAAR